MDKQHSFRLLNTGFHDGYYNMGLDEALLETVAAGGAPVLRFYGWSPPAVSVGYFQGLTEEVDLDAAKRYGFDVVRRISGGGAVLHKSELTYSIIMKLDHPLAGKTLDESYRTLCAGLVEGLALLGIEGVFSGINDILAGGKKISGNAQTRRMGCLLQHGTILLDNDVDVMFEVLKVPAEKNNDKRLSDSGLPSGVKFINEVKERVCSLHALLGRVLPFEEAVTAFARGFEERLGLVYEKAAVLPDEDSRARELAETKFSSGEWLFKK
jgi:lipoate-protein ligase A